MTQLVDAAKDAFAAAIDAADPARAVARHMEGLAGPVAGRRVVLALGKAANAMAGAALEALPGAEALVVTAPDSGETPAGATGLIGAHPVPTEDSLKGGAALHAAATALGPDDEALVLISGGGSALAVLPKPGITLADKIRLNELLLASGLDIVAMNLIRQQVSALKGGGLLRAAAPARVTSLILSDVIGDDLRAIASGPTVAQVGTAEEARATAEAAGIWDALPESIRATIERAEDAPSLPESRAILVGSNSQSVAAAAAALGDRPHRIVDAPLVGNVSEAGPELLRLAKTGSFVTGGETTVTLGDAPGMGGRNQDLALRFALLAEEANLPGNWAFLSGGTDGRDGPTDSAGAVVTPDTLAAIRSAGLDPAAHLARNDAYPALDAAEALLKMPPSGTNVADVQIFLSGE